MVGPDDQQASHCCAFGTLLIGLDFDTGRDDLPTHAQRTTRLD